MGVFGKIKNAGKRMGRTIITTAYEDSGAQKLKRNVTEGSQDFAGGARHIDRTVFGGKGLRHNVKDVRKLLKQAGTTKKK